MTRCLLAWMISSCLLSNAQSVNTIMGARVAGAGYASSIIADESSLLNNVGAMASVTNKSVFFAYEIEPLLPGANRVACALLVPLKLGTAGLGFFRFGDDLYNEQLASLGWSHKLGLTSIGVKVNYVQYFAQGYGTKTGLSMGFGGLTHITPEISIGAYIVNLALGNLAAEEQLPTLLITGIGLKPNDEVFIGTEVEKVLGHGATWRSGIEYNIHKKIFFRTGFIVNPNAGCFGFGGRVRSLKIDYSIKLSVVLGTAHQVSCVYTFSKNASKQ